MSDTPPPSSEEYYDENGRREDRTRPCPTCRMMISVLAIKCRFCGAEVGRPRDEARTFTVEDLGGENIHHYAPSSNVMEALESFRADTAASSAGPQGKRRRGRRGKGEGQEKGPGAAGLPELSEQSRALASLSMPNRRAVTGSAGKSKKKKGSVFPWQKGLYFGGGFLLAAVVIYLGSGLVAAMIRGNQEQHVEVRNEAAGLLQEGRYLDAYEEAVSAASQAPTPGNQALVAEAEAAIAAEASRLLNATENWSRDNIKDALALVERAARIRPTDVLNELHTDATADLRLYSSLFLEQTDTTGDNESVTIRRQYLSEDEEIGTYTEGELVADRFEVQRIASSYVRLVDTKRGGRVLQLGHGGLS